MKAMADANREIEIRKLRAAKISPLQRHADWSVSYEWTSTEIDCLLRLLDTARVELSGARSARAPLDAEIERRRNIDRQRREQIGRLQDTIEHYQRGTDERAPPPADAMEAHGRCPKCGSRQPNLHPATGFEGEVQPCRDPYHLKESPQNLPKYREAVSRAIADAMEAAQEALRGCASKSHHGNGAVERVARAITAARADERRKAIEEAAHWHDAQAKHHRTIAAKYNDAEGWRSADKANIHERSANCLRALATKGIER